MTPLSTRMVEAAAIARHEHCRRRTPLVVSIGWYDLDPEDQACMLAEAHASLTAALALAIEAAALERAAVVAEQLPSPDFIYDWPDAIAAAIRALKETT